jgi:peptide/nickel transport system permease protein
VLLAIVISALVAVALSQALTRKGRILVFGFLGAGSGVWMSAALPGELSIPVALLLCITGGSLLGGFAALDYVMLRTTMLGILGCILGTAVTVAATEPDMARGFLLDRLWHLVLPVICLSYGGFAFLAKLTRSAVLENLQSDFARTARAKGAPENIVLWRHVFRNSLLPLITVSAALLPGLLAGSVIVESIFSIDGMGKLAVEAVQTRDRELVLSITFVSGLLTLLSYLIADLCYAFADPRVSYE